MKLKTFAGRAAAAGAVLAALVLAALPVWAAPRVQVDKKNAVADHADILSAETENYINEISISLSDACGAQIGVYTVDELLGNTTMEGFAYNVFNDWELGSADQNNGVLLLLAPYEADGGDYYIMRGSGLESRLSISALGSLLDEYMEPYWATGDYDTGTQKTVQALANRLCSIYGVTLDSGYAANTTARGGATASSRSPTWRQRTTTCVRSSTRATSSTSARDVTRSSNGRCPWGRTTWQTTCCSTHRASRLSSSPVPTWPVSPRSCVRRH